MVSPLGTIPGTTKAGIAVTSVDNAAMKAQAAKVAAALDATTKDPSSPYYQAPDETGRAPSSVAPANLAATEARMAAEAPTTVEGGGQAAH